MDMDEYQQRARETAEHPVSNDLKSINYCLLGLGGEAGEAFNVWKKMWRGDYDDGRPYGASISFNTVRGKLLEEAGDALWYIANLAHELGFTLSELAEINLQKLKRRQAEGNIKGEHEVIDYTEIYDLPDREPVRPVALGETVDYDAWQKWIADGNPKQP